MLHWSHTILEDSPNRFLCCWIFFQEDISQLDQGVCTSSIWLPPLQLWKASSNWSQCTANEELMGGRVSELMRSLGWKPFSRERVNYHGTRVHVRGVLYKHDQPSQLTLLLFWDVATCLSAFVPWYVLIPWSLPHVFVWF